MIASWNMQWTGKENPQTYHNHLSSSRDCILVLSRPNQLTMYHQNHIDGYRGKCFGHDFKLIAQITRCFSLLQTKQSGLELWYKEI